MHGDSLMINGHNTNVIVVEKEDVGKICPCVNRDLLVWGENPGQFQLEITQCALSHHMARPRDIEHQKPAKSVARS